MVWRCRFLQAEPEPIVDLCLQGTHWLQGAAAAYPSGGNPQEPPTVQPWFSWCEAV